MPQWLPAWAESNGTLQKKKKEKKRNNKRSTWALSRRARDRVLQPRYIPETDRNCVQRSWSQIQLDLLPHSEKKQKVEITKHKQKDIPVISRLQRAVNINNRNVQVESVGWRFPHALRATWEFHASVHEPTEGTSLFQICVTAFAYISILSSVLFFLFSVMIFFFFFSFSPLVWTPAQAVQISRTTVHSWSSGSHIRTNTQTRFQPMLVNQPFFFVFVFFLPNNDWPCQDTEWCTAQ